MNEPNEPMDRSLDDWLDGDLGDHERGRFEERMSDDPALSAQVACQEAIDGSLRRSFSAPEELLASWSPSVAPASVLRAKPHLVRSMVGVLAAAGLLFVFTRFAVQDRDGEASGMDVPNVARVLPIDPLRDEPDIDTPNLERLYANAVEQEERSMCSSPDDLSELERELAARYGPGLSVLPGASGMIHGPFDSDEWPSGTVLTSYPDGPGGQPVVLVAEEDAQLACCLNVGLPQTSALQSFTWKIGSLSLTEITPHAEPRLIDYFARR